MDSVIEVYGKVNGTLERIELYIGGVAYVNFEKNYINISSDGSNSIDWQHIQFEKIECDFTHRHFVVTKKEK